MSIHIILGKPGSGKSRHATELVVRQLRETKRNVVTNLPLRVGRLNEFLQQRWPCESIDLVRRLRVLTDDEMRTFWRFRGPDLRSEYDDVTQTDQDKRFGDDEGRGVAYFLDEAHIAFNARDWAVLGRDALHYMSQHRKLGDVVFPITQAVGNLDKQFRSVAEDYTVLRNEAVMKMGPFRGAARFKARMYYSEPSGNADPYQTITFNLDKDGYASCYDTAKGIGVHGSLADIGRRAQGISIYWVFPIVLVVGLACVGVPMLLGRAASSFVTGGSKKVVSKVGAGVAPVEEAAGPTIDKRSQPASGNSAAPLVAAHSPAPVVGAAAPQQPVWMVGRASRSDRDHVLLSDGRILQTGDGQLRRVTKFFAETVTGERYWLGKAAAKNPAPSNEKPR